MATMIPAGVDERTPPGEADVFRSLASGPPTWTVVHSLDIAPWNRGLRTEIDFMVVIPAAGILCIEVKSHDRIFFDGRTWHPDSIRRSPFKQAADGSFGLHRALADRAPRFAQVPIAHMCIFPRAVFDMAPNIAVAEWELMDARVYDRLLRSGKLHQELESRLRRAVAVSASLTSLPAPLSSAEVEGLVRMCTPVRRRPLTDREEIRLRERDAEAALHLQQRPVMQLAHNNPRVIVSGGAGTGKTRVALALALQLAATGKRVALVCFNELVGDWLAQQVTKTGVSPPTLLVGRAVQIMMRLAGEVPPANPSSRYWDDEFPAHLEERLTDPEFRAVALFDHLVLDEAQDLLGRPALLHCLLAFLDGGATEGRYVLLGDLEHQVLSGRDAIASSLDYLRTSGKPTTWVLTENCRNYEIIGAAALKLSGKREGVYSGYLRTGGGVRNYDVRPYEDAAGQQAGLRWYLDEAKREGYAPSEVSVLSFCTTERSVATDLARERTELQPARPLVRGVGYTSVSRFKGMENKVIIVTDVMLDDREFLRDLFYTAITRATENVRILCHASSVQVLLRWMVEGENR